MATNVNYTKLYYLEFINIISFGIIIDITKSPAKPTMRQWMVGPFEYGPNIIEGVVVVFLFTNEINENDCGGVVELQESGNYNELAI